MIINFRYHICTNYGISKLSYEDVNDLIGEMGQGNRFLGNGSWDTLCYILKNLENRKLEVALWALISNHTIQRVVIAFIDDTNFYTNRSQYKEKIQQMLAVYIRLYEVIGSAIQQSKSYYYGW